jgi:tripartite-type tricarboxylate transporter receptor subunit TctC
MAFLPSIILTPPYHRAVARSIFDSHNLPAHHAAIVPFRRREQQGGVMNSARRRLLTLACAAAAWPLVARGSLAQSFPNRPLRWLVPFAPGGSTDIIARLVGGSMSERLGQSVVIENKPGAGTIIATQVVAGAPPDGYTLLFVSTSSATNATFYDNLPYNFLRDLAPVAALVRSPFVLAVNPAVPAKNVAELIAHAKANPGKINMATTGIGTSVHLAGELLQAMAGITVVNVPYRGEAPAINDLIAGQAHAIFGSPAATLPHVQSGALRAIAVSSAARMSALPDVATVADTVPGYEASTFYGVAAPKGTPADVVERLNREINAALASPVIAARITELGSAVLALSPADFGKLIVEETEKWGRVIRTANIKPE